ncbi:hypothetical protein PRIPAC_95911 [Pristionchus pacificus]|uniref:Uncharacterized protein n=1 Tax=Pristionchus pacificus TaxID=54126 RepID=A0A2A6D139_PRIPA|nr:hypothetical protein PRIPAC_95911 [Pristionchus pacificus]|eukprot:PDM84098.1 hypothetical protein PRIPAC_34290 [Pristionchus pacificus]
MSLVLLFYTMLSPIFLLSFTALEIIVSLRPLLYLGVVHEFIHLFIAFDRFLAYWKQLFSLSMLVAFLLPFAVTWQTFFNDVEFNKSYFSSKRSTTYPFRKTC